ncbi:O-antigen ligase [Sphaerochaeta sp. S2]|uniref:O-antigen ligase family protein n=1 Tax=Sphaerochaeta sp. S2 TaxID=2798868 RepID=UPI0018E94C8D|nr:O-antigen ligase family protein [Sphaerochaeta sp. S2]MBJ2356836.1 O-antigen ligase family protein [Sphaerochaeta sp. S2]
MKHNTTVLEGPRYTLLHLIGLFKVPLFFSVVALLGYEGLSETNPRLYAYIMSIIGIVNMATILWVVARSDRFTIKDIVVLLGIPFIMLLSYYTAIVLGRHHPQNSYYFSLFLGFSLPAIFIGYYLGKAYRRTRMVDIGRYVEIIMLVISVGGFVTILIPFMQGARFTTLGGASYQSASYYSALAFGLNLYFIVWGRNHVRFRLLTTRFYKIFSVLLLVLQFVMVVIPGGRGAFVLAVLYVLLALFEILRVRKVKKILQGTLFVIGLVVVAIMFLPRLMENPLFASSFNRAIAFIDTGGGVNWDGTSGRLPYYENALSLISEAPIIGYGIFGFRNVYGKEYPHNLILELLLQGGVVYLAFWTVLLTVLARRLFRNMRRDVGFRAYLFIAAYPLVMLMFSGTYISTGLFWFMVAFLATCPVNRAVLD